MYRRVPASQPSLAACQPGQSHHDLPLLPVDPVSPQPGGPSPTRASHGPKRGPTLEWARSSAPTRRYDETERNWKYYRDSLAQIQDLSRSAINFAETYRKVAWEEPRVRHVSHRLPTEQEVSGMLGNVDNIVHWLEYMKVLALALNQSNRSSWVTKGGGLCSEKYNTPTTDAGDVKHKHGAAYIKRSRRRAAAWGRCHRCGRTDTPEWRRGPDGARTLCNACGLVHAKLERKLRRLKE
ncbi:GATA-type domain-containing protein [Fusarium keratoplasticum]|uniref:GATA-type domain-containing protein n=1 Tax=Fusarium keratoplasticum TaxID=1328300 RepID=A0ACC0QT08_9HYPO|nr:GATA-type domain-containing protein [Fusarium keratoplasticum]KAI8665772.1 GATA-type domain-containing protein [Fusarium keratoplasticum]